MTTRKSKLELVRKKAIAAGIPNISELARLVPCSRVSLYNAIEKPRRYSRVARRIQQLTAA